MLDADKPFEGKSMAMIFEKPSTRTRMSFDIAAKQLRGILNYFESRWDTLRQRRRNFKRYSKSINRVR